MPAQARRQLRRRPADLSGCTLDGLPPLLQRLYAARGVREQAELDYGLAGLPDPAGLLGIDAAVTLLEQALRSGRRIVVIGDYDADGASSAALAMTALGQMGAGELDFLVPDRLTMGYGLSPALVELARQHSAELLLTVDSGIACHAGISAARAAGMQVVVTDHHLPGETLPPADAIVNPRQPGCTWPAKNLAGVGVVFCLMIALRRRLREAGCFAGEGPNLAELLDLVALGTVADLVPLDRYNRILVAQGLARMRAGQTRPGVQALMSVAGRDLARACSSDIGFAIGPRLNAAGRLDDMRHGINCLLAPDMPRALALAGELDRMNRERREIEAGMRADAERAVARLLAEAEAPVLPAAICLHQADWHPGVVGLVASRIKDRWHRPVIAFADAGEDELRGSARSIPGLHLRDTLAAIDARNPGMIRRFGGHAMAAGLTLERGRLEPFEAAFREQVLASVEPEVFDAVLYSDGELAPEELCLAAAEQLRSAGPWGQQFPEPCFDGRFRLLQQRVVGERHLKMVLSPAASPQLRLDAIQFQADLATWPDPQVEWVELAYRLDVNEYRGQRSVQLLVEELRSA